MTASRFETSDTDPPLLRDTRPNNFVAVLGALDHIRGQLDEQREQHNVDFAGIRRDISEMRTSLTDRIDARTMPRWMHYVLVLCAVLLAGVAVYRVAVAVPTQSSTAIDAVHR